MNNFEVVWNKINIIIAQPLANIIARVLAAIVIIVVGIKLTKIIAKKYFYQLATSSDFGTFAKTIKSI